MALRETRIPRTGSDLEVVEAHPEPRLRVARRKPREKLESFASSVRAGLSDPKKWLSCCWFYDTRGSDLFEQICLQPEYYLTRAERAILERHRQELPGLWPGPVTLAELGSGSSSKTRLLIDIFHHSQDRLSYCPVDISEEMLRQAALDLLQAFPRLTVEAVAGDYAEGLRHIGRRMRKPLLILFLGSTIGNFRPKEASLFLQDLRQIMVPGDGLLLGMDLKKHRSILEAAYNDAAGVTAAFNRNLLVRINRELGGAFDPETFHHRATYDEDRGCVEMELVSRQRQTVEIKALSSAFHFEAHEPIFTECCYKYSAEDRTRLAADAGFSVARSWTDPDHLFSLSLLIPRLTK